MHGSRTRTDRRGFTLMEVSLAMTVLLVAMLATTASTLRAHALRRANRERVLAQNSVRGATERLQSLAARAADDPAGWSTAVLNGIAANGDVAPTFEVSELTAQVGQATVGTIEVIIDETRTDASLGCQLGMPRDLDGDGAATNANVTGTALLLPVVVRARWNGSRGAQAIAHGFYLSRF
jgi:prepilin-type N-terminal cleavage/methylation domain-containing protein